VSGVSVQVLALTTAPQASIFPSVVSEYAYTLYRVSSI
jgi:hypothetical protein